MESNGRTTSVKETNKVVFVRTGWMKYFGALPEQGAPIGGGSHNEEKVGAEFQNFRKRDGNSCQGYVRIGSTAHGFNLKRVCADVPRGAEKVDDVLVIVVATDPQKRHQVIVGWYKNADVYAEVQQDRRVWLFSARWEDCVLLPPAKRTHVIPKREGAFGQSNVCYTNDTGGRRKQDHGWISAATNFVRKYRGANALDFVLADDLKLETFQYVHVPESSKPWRKELKTLLECWYKYERHTPSDSPFVRSIAIGFCTPQARPKK